MLWQIAIMCVGILECETKPVCRAQRRYGVWRGIAFSIFHAVSAFCNAGFDLMGYDEAYSSLVSFEGDVLVNVVVMFLILTGGIGFVVWDDLMRNKWHFKKYLLHPELRDLIQRMWQGCPMPVKC